MSFSKKHWIALLATLILVTLMLFLPTLKSEKENLEADKTEQGSMPESSADQMLMEADSMRMLLEAEADSSVKTAIASRTIKRYEQVLKKSPDNADARAGLGLTLAEATSDPMKGIMMLREVSTKNPENEKAQFYLGILSIQSGQFEKAASRFEKVLEINSENINVYLYLGDVYMKLGNTEKAILNFEQFCSKTKNEAMKKQVEEMMSRIKTEGKKQKPA